MTNLSPGAVSLMVALREPLTVVQACQAAALSGNYGRTTIAFLASKKLVAITGRHGQSHVYSITQAGEEFRQLGEALNLADDLQSTLTRRELEQSFRPVIATRDAGRLESPHGPESRNQDRPEPGPAGSRSAA